MWHEPFLLISGYFTLLFLFIIYVRIDLGVNYKNENTDRVSEILLRFQEEVYDVYSSAFTSLDQSFASKSEKDYKQQRENQGKRLEKAKASVRSIEGELASVEPSLVNRLGDLLKNLDNKFNAQKSLHEAEFAGQSGKIKDQAEKSLEAAEEAVERSYHDIFEREHN